MALVNPIPTFGNTSLITTPPQLCGFVCAYNPAAPCSNPKHLYLFQFVEIELVIDNGTRKGQK